MRGDVYELKAPRAPRGREQSGRRYCVVVQGDHFDHVSTWVVAPTSRAVREGLLYPRIDVGSDTSTVLIQQMRAVDPTVRLGRLVGRVSLAEQQEIDRALRLILGLD